MSTGLKNIFRYSLLLLAMSASTAGAGEKDEVLLKTCFPREEFTVRKWEDCADEDCGLRDEPLPEEKAPTVEKGQQYLFLGGTDLGVLWGATEHRVIGEDRVRFLLYIMTTVTTKTHHYESGGALVPVQVIRKAFYSSFGERRGTTVAVAYDRSGRSGRHEEIMGGEGEIQMVDLHCSARKIKIYDSTTMYYRTIADTAADSSCVELLWEKPKTPLPWQNASAMTMDILTKHYCGKQGR